MSDTPQSSDYMSREARDRLTPQEVIDILTDGNRRFCEGCCTDRNFPRQVQATAPGQHPLAVVLGCIDSRVPIEHVFDLGIGEAFGVRVAGNVVGTKSLGSIEYGVAVAGVKLVVVLGHTRCGAVTSSIQLLGENQDVQSATGCAHLPAIVSEVTENVGVAECEQWISLEANEQELFVDEVAQRNVKRAVSELVQRSDAIRSAVENGQIQVVGAMYDVRTGKVKFLDS